MRVADLVEYLKNLNPNTDLKITQRSGGLTTWVKVIPHDNEVWLMPFNEEPDSLWYDYERCCPGACNGGFQRIELYVNLFKRIKEMKRINSIRQLKKHLKAPFDRMFPFSVITYTDTFYDGRKGIFIDRVEGYHLYDNFKSKTVKFTFKRRETVADSFLDETYTLFNFPNKVIIKHG